MSNTILRESLKKLLKVGELKDDIACQDFFEFCYIKRKVQIGDPKGYKKCIEALENLKCSIEKCLNPNSTKASSWNVLSVVIRDIVKTGFFYEKEDFLKLHREQLGRQVGLEKLYDLISSSTFKPSIEVLHDFFQEYQYDPISLMQDHSLIKIIFKIDALPGKKHTDQIKKDEKVSADINIKIKERRKKINEKFPKNIYLVFPPVYKNKRTDEKIKIDFLEFALSQLASIYSYQIEDDSPSKKATEDHRNEILSYREIMLSFADGEKNKAKIMADFDKKMKLDFEERKKNYKAQVEESKLDPFIEFSRGRFGGGRCGREIETLKMKILNESFNFVINEIKNVTTPQINRNSYTCILRLLGLMVWDSIHSIETTKPPPNSIVEVVEELNTWVTNELGWEEIVDSITTYYRITRKCVYSGKFISKNEASKMKTPEKPY